MDRTIGERNLTTPRGLLAQLVALTIVAIVRTSPTTSCLPDLAHERATSPLFKASAFAFRSFPLLIRLPSAFAPLGNKRHHLWMARAHYQLPWADWRGFKRVCHSIDSGTRARHDSKEDRMHSTAQGSHSVRDSRGNRNEINEMQESLV